MLARPAGMRRDAGADPHPDDESDGGSRLRGGGGPPHPQDPHLRGTARSRRGRAECGAGGAGTRRGGAGGAAVGRGDGPVDRGAAGRGRRADSAGAHRRPQPHQPHRDRPSRRGGIPLRARRADGGGGGVARRPCGPGSGTGAASRALGLFAARGAGAPSTAGRQRRRRHAGRWWCSTPRARRWRRGLARTSLSPSRACRNSSSSAAARFSGPEEVAREALARVRAGSGGDAGRHAGGEEGGAGHAARRAAPAGVWMCTRAARWGRATVSLAPWCCAWPKARRRRRPSPGGGGRDGGGVPARHRSSARGRHRRPARPHRVRCRRWRSREARHRAPGGQTGGRGGAGERAARHPPPPGHACHRGGALACGPPLADRCPRGGAARFLGRGAPAARPWQRPCVAAIRL